MVNILERVEEGVMKGLVVTIFLISIVFPACVKRPEPASEEQGLGAVAGDSAKGLGKLMTVASDDVAKAMRKFVDEGDIRGLSAIFKRGGKEADEALGLCTVFIKQQEENILDAAKKYREVEGILIDSKSSVSLTTEVLQPFVSRLESQTDDLFSMFKLLDEDKKILPALKTSYLSLNYEDLDIFYRLFSSSRGFPSYFSHDGYSKISEISGSIRGRYIKGSVDYISSKIPSRVSDKINDLFMLYGDLSGRSTKLVKKFVEKAEYIVSEGQVLQYISRLIKRSSEWNFAAHDLLEIKRLLAELAAKGDPRIGRLYENAESMLLPPAERKKLLKFLDEIKQQ